ncbi:MAG: DMT family transporter [Rhodospirillales bacterium]|nr:DMT family transporter [Rhodospirillales bacterium]
MLYAATAIIGASALIALTTLLAKSLGLGMEGPQLHPLQISAGRFFFAFLAISLFSAFRRPSFKGAAWHLHLIRSICGWTGISLLFAAVARMPLADATAITFLNPIVAMALAIPLLAERVGPLRWLAAGISLAGALVLIRPGTDAFQPAALIALAAAAVMGVEIICIKILSRSEPPVRILLINNSFGALISITAACFVWTQPNATQLLMLAALGITMALAQSLFIQAMKNADASYVIPFSYSTLIFAAFYDFMLFGQVPAATSLLGAAIIVGGAVLLAWREQRAQKSRV